MLKLINKNTIIIQNKDTVFMIEIDTILYIEKVKNSKVIIITTPTDKIECVCTLRDIFKILNNKFFQAHKSVIVNSKFVKSIDKTESIVYLSSGDVIYGSQKFLCVFFELLGM